MVLSRKIKFVFLFSLFVTGIFFLYANFVSSSNPDYRVGFETSMRKVFIKNDIQPFQGKWADQVNNQWSISLAKNEYESFQVVVEANKDLRDVTVYPINSTSLKIESVPVGFANISVVSVGLSSKYAGWYPDPILTFTKGVDIENGDYQPFWITVYASRSTDAGDKQVKLRIRADNSESKELTINIHVYDFTLPDKPSLPTAMAWQGKNDIQQIYEETASWPERESNSRHILKKEFDYLIDKYRLFPDRIYGGGSGFLRREFQERGWIDFSNLMAGPTYFKKNEKNGDYYVFDKKLSEFMPDYLKNLKNRFNKLPEEMKQNVFTYVCDEVPFERFNIAMKRILEPIKKEVPGIKIVIDSFGDAIYPNYNEKFANLIDVLCYYQFWSSKGSDGRNSSYAKARDFLHKNGKKIWWVITGTTPMEINWLIESKLISTRLLLGFTSYKLKSDGLLYWDIASWADGGKNNHGPIKLVKGSYCNFHYNLSDPRYVHNGAGILILPGPETIIPTIRLANFRDGMEDYEYLKILECLRSKSNNHSLNSLADKLLKIDSRIVSYNAIDHTYSSSVVYTERERIAQLIESLGGNASRCRGPFSKTSSSYCGDGSCNNGETCSTCPADCGACPTPHYNLDINQDGKTDIQDLGILLSHWGKTDKGRYDINQDGKTDSGDAVPLLLAI